jgi:hypothetical protein
MQYIIIICIHSYAEPGAKRHNYRLSVRDDIRFSSVDLHLPFFGEARASSEWCQATTDQKIESKFQSASILTSFCVSERKKGKTSTPVGVFYSEGLMLVRPTWRYTRDKKTCTSVQNCTSSGKSLKIKIW